MSLEIQPIHGIRSMMCISVFFLHVCFFLRSIILTDEHWRFLSQPLIASFSGKGVQVDVFFMLSGFLVGLKYFSKGEKSETFKKSLSSSWDFLKSRMFRVFPVTICSLLVGLILKDFGWETIPSLFVFMNNYFYPPSSVGPAWSNAADVQMNVVLIILFSIFGLSMKTVGGLLLTAWLIRLVSIFTHPIPLTMGNVLNYSHNSSNSRVMSPSVYSLITNVLGTPLPPSNEVPIPFGFVMYLPSWSRFGPCVVGFGLSFLYLKSLKDKTQNQSFWLRKPFSWLWLFVIYFFAIFMFIPKKSSAPTQSHIVIDVIFTVLFQSLVSFGWAGILFTTICPSDHPLHCPRVKSFLSSNFFRWFAPLTFSFYMLHYRILLEFIFNWIPRKKWVQQFLFGRTVELGEFLTVEFFDIWVVLKIFVVVFPVVLLVSYLVHKFVEKPILDWYSTLKTTTNITTTNTNINKTQKKSKKQ